MQRNGNRKTQTIMAKLVKLISLIFCLSVGLIFLGNYIITKQIIFNDTQKTIHSTVDYYEAKVHSWFDLRIDQQKSLAQSIMHLPTSKRTDEALLDLLTNSTKYGGEYGVIADYVVFPNKKMISGDGWIPEAGYDPTKNSYYTEAVKSGEMYISAPYVDQTTKQFIVTVSRPLLENGKLYAVLGRDFNIEEVRKFADGHDSSMGSYLFLIDKDGYILRHIDTNYQSDSTQVYNIKTIPEMKEIAESLGAQELKKLHDYDGESKYFLSKQENLTGWTVGYLFPEQIIQDRLFRQALINLVVFLIALAVSILILISVLRGILAPIKTIVSVASDLEQGNLNIQANVQTSDELGVLATGFNSTARYLNEIIGEISAILDQIAGGDLRILTHCEYRGDFSRIQLSINNIARNLNDVMGGIGQAATMVASGSEQVANGAQLLSQGAVEQANQIDVLTQEVNEIVGEIRNNAQRCVDASTLTVEVGKQLDISNREMHEMMDAMHKINSASEQISKIIKTIEDIAFQTNILALNAAVEAARAGSAGKGFAVVADEVRNLASKSAQAAKHTAELITDSVQAVENGSRIADLTAQSLLEVMENAKQAEQTIREIAELSNIQATQIQEVSRGIDEISNVVQTNSATSEESAATSEQLSSQAQNMRALVARFQLDNDNERIHL